MSPDGGLGYSECIGNLGDASDLHDGDHDAQFGRREAIGLGDDLGQRWRSKHCLVDEERSNGGVDLYGAAASWRKTGTDATLVADLSSAVVIPSTSP